MSIFIMEPVLSSSTQVSEKTLWQAEALLQSLADHISRISEWESRAIEKKSKLLVETLREDKAKQRSKSDRKVKQTAKTIGELNNRLQQLHENLAIEISLLTGKESTDSMPLGKVLEWKQREDARLDGIYFDTDHRLAQYSSELDNHTVQLNHVRTELQTTSTDLSELVKEDQRLRSADRTKTIQTEINELSVSITAVLKKAAKICKVPYRKTLKIDDLIGNLEKELEEIDSGLMKAGESLKETDIIPPPKSKRKKAGKSKSSDLETVVDKIKAMVEEKRDQLRDLQILRTDLVRLSRLEKTARHDLSGELARLEKQKARASIINEIKTKQEYRKQNLGLIQEKITEIEESIDSIRKKQFSIRKRKRFNDQKTEKIQAIKAEIDNCISMLNAEKSKRASITPSTDIWYRTIQNRIKKVRRHINFGSPLRLLFLPFQCYNGYQVGLKVRMHLIKVERSFQQLGLLDEDYIQRIDIFNRANKKGQKLCLDVLYC